MPAIEVESQLALATLLISYTNNIQDARQRLERAVSHGCSYLMSQTSRTCSLSELALQDLVFWSCKQVVHEPKALVMKCRVAIALAKCQGLLGEHRLQCQTLQRALSYYKDSNNAADRQDRYRHSSLQTYCIPSWAMMYCIGGSDAGHNQWPVMSTAECMLFSRLT